MAVKDKLANQRNMEEQNKIKGESHITCRAHVLPLPYHAAKGLECAFPI